MAKRTTKPADAKVEPKPAVAKAESKPKAEKPAPYEASPLTGNEWERYIETKDANERTVKARQAAAEGARSITFVGITAQHLVWLLSELPDYELAVPLGTGSRAVIKRRV